MTVEKAPPAGYDQRNGTSRNVAVWGRFKKSCAVFVTALTALSCVQVAMGSGINGWPKKATKKSIVAKVGIDQWNKAERVALCETGKRVRWYVDSAGNPTGKFVSSMGMYVRTYEFGRRASGFSGATFAEQVAIAIAAHPITRGWSGWGCGGA